MALSLEALHKPLNKFFLELLATGPESPVSFFFGKGEPAIDDNDYVDVSVDPPVYDRNRALESWSALVNLVPVAQADGISVVLTQNGIDTTYGLRMLKPSLPYLSAAADPASRDHLIGQFSQLKDFALKRWDQLSRESSTGLMLSYVPSPPSPADWGDPANSSVWTAHSLQIQGEPTPGSPAAPDNRLWRLKIDDAALATALGEQTPAPKPARTLFSRLVTAKKANLAGQPVKGLAGGGMMHFTHLAAAHAKPAAVTNFSLHDGFRKNIGLLSVRERLQVSELLLPKAPTRPVTTPGISVSFEYCVIRVTRPWLVDAFLNDGSWCIPGIAKGELTAPDQLGATLPLLPIAAVIVRKLRITASWTPEDVTAAADATNFGPFRVAGGIVDGSIAREGMQVIGWLMQRMPTLPPNDPDPPSGEHHG